MNVYEHLAQDHIQNNQDCFPQQYWVSRTTLLQHYSQHHPNIKVPEQLNSKLGVVRKRADYDAIFEYDGVDDVDYSDADDQLLVRKTVRTCEHIQSQLVRAQDAEVQATKAADAVAKVIKQMTQKLEALQSRKRKCADMVQYVSKTAERWTTFQNGLRELCPASCGEVNLI